MKKLLSIILSLVLLLSVLGSISFNAYADPVAGEKIKFGAYPQSEVKDATLLSELRAIDFTGKWISYGYASKTGTQPKDTTDFGDIGMCYCDFSYKGASYRAVKIPQYRSDSQYYNGYTSGKVYFFKYEPLSWIVYFVGSDFGGADKLFVLLSDKTIDAQPFIESTFKGTDGCSKSFKQYNGNYYDANHYLLSSVADFLNGPFYNTAFNSTQKSKMDKWNACNRSDGTSYQCVDMGSREMPVTLLHEEILGWYAPYNTDRGSNVTRIGTPTDYAKIQGLDTTTDIKNHWMLIDATANSTNILGVRNDGSISSQHATRDDTGGIRPLIILKNFCSDSYTIPTFKNAVRVTTSSNNNGGSVSASQTVFEGASCTVTATPSLGYAFKGWHKDGSITTVSTNASYTFTANESVMLTAEFEQVSPIYNISVSASPTAGGTVSGGGTFINGNYCTVTANANSNYNFDGWYENGVKVSSLASYKFQTTKSRTLVAKFTVKDSGGSGESGGGNEEGNENGGNEGGNNSGGEETKPLSDLSEKGATPAQVDEYITSLPDDNDPPGTKFSFLFAKQKKITKNSIIINWKKPKNAARFVIYGAKCGKYKYKKIKSTTNTSFKYKNLKKGTYYKFIVVAYNSDNNLIGASNTVHIATKGNSKKSNFKSVKTAAKKNRVTLKKGKSFKLKGKGVKAKNQKVSVHRGIRYESSNEKIAKVTSKGVIKAKKKGVCYVYVYAQNGAYKKIKVTVK